MKTCQLNPKSEFHPSNLWAVFSVTGVMHWWQIIVNGHSIITVAMKMEQLLH